jgi:hypothetical protein
MILILILLILIKSVFNSNDCDLILEKQILTIKNKFQSFSELNFTKCNDTFIDNEFIIFPKKKLLLDNSLDFKQISLYSKRMPLFVILKNIKGFDLESNPFETLRLIDSKTNKTKKLYYFILQDTFFNFYYRNKLVNNEMCNKNLLKPYQYNFFTSILGLDAATPDVIYQENICPLIFSKSKIDYLLLSSTNSLFIKNSLTFSNISDDLAKYINSIIFDLDLRLYHIDLNEKLLNKHVFNKLVRLTLNGVIHSIDDDLFKSFDYLKLLRLKMENIQNIFHKKNKWLQYLNNKVYVNDLSIKYNFQKTFGLIIEQTHFNHSYYNFPDEDFCYFKDFPHNKLVMPVLKPFELKQLNNVRSCTKYFLTQYSSKYEYEIVFAMRSINQNGYIDAYYYKDLDEYISVKKHDKCNDFFKNKIANCKIEKLDRNLDFHFYIFDWNILVKYNQIIFSIILNPLFGLICFGLNILTIMILTNKYINDKQNMYSDLKMNSTFMLLFNFISMFKPLYVCINKSNWNDANLFIDFCLIQGFVFGIGRYLHIIFIKFFCNSFKTSSNIYYLLFTIYRYCQTTDSKNKHLNKIIKISFIKKASTIILISLIVNLYSYFQYSNSSLSVTSMKLRYYFSNHNRYLNITELSKLNDLNDYNQDLNDSALLILKIFNIIKIVFSDFFLSILIFVFDILLFIFVKKNMDKKRDITALILTSNSKNFKKFRNIKNTKARLSSMILLNGFNLLVFRTPSLVLNLYGFIYRYDNVNNKHLPNLYAYNICRTQHFCNLLTEIAFFLYLISIIFQFFIFLKLDKNFKYSFNDIFSRKNSNIIRRNITRRIN